MYAQHFQLAGTPFSIAPDPRFLYMSAQHREALAHLLYGIGAGGGFVLLTGEIGAGKTTICRSLLQQVPPHCEIAYVFNPRLSAAELLRTVCEEFGIDVNAGNSHKELIDALNRHLLERHAQGAASLLIIDEAQNLSADVLEQLRLLTNLETSERKLLQIILIGQPELRRLVEQPRLEQLAQRIIARYHLGPLSRDETRAYIVHRLAVAGARSAPLFSDSAMRLVYRLTGGVPRRINLVCDRAMLGAYAGNKATVDSAQVRRAAREVFARPRSHGPARWLAPAALAGLLVAAGAAFMLPPSPATDWLTSALAIAEPRQPVAAGGGTDSTAGSARDPGVTEPAEKLAVSADAKDIAKADDAANAEAAPAASATAAPVAAAAPTTALPAPLEFDLLLDGASTNDAQVLSQLAASWDIRLAGKGDTDVCSLAREQGLYCYKGRGGFTELRQLNRPALLRLRDSQQGDRFVILRGLSPSVAVVERDAEPVKVRLPALESHFTGEFVTFWRMPNEFRSQLHAGARGPDVEWVARQLAKLAGESPAEGPAVMDRNLARQVRQFQLTQGLLADSVVGPKTWMRLNAAAGVAEPRLMSEQPPILARQ